MYTLELCRALRTEEQITIFCRKGAPRPLEGVQWKDKLYAGGKGWAEALMRYGGGLLALAAEICTGHYDVLHVQGFNIRYSICCPMRRRPGIADCTAIFTVSATFWWSITYTAASC